MTHHQHPKRQRAAFTIGQTAGAHLELNRRLAKRDQQEKQAEIRRIERAHKWDKRREAFFAIYCRFTSWLRW